MATLHIKTVIEGEVFTHRVLWYACQRQLCVARSDPKDSRYFYLTAMLMAYMVFEAYINYLGTKLSPDLWEDERNNFRAQPYNGTSGKLLKLCELFDVPFPNKGVRPYQSIALLKQLRDMVVHGKPDEFKKTVKHSAEENPCIIEYKLGEYVSKEKAEQAIADTKQLIDNLNTLFLSVAGSELINESALDGTQGLSIGHMSTEP